MLLDREGLERGGDQLVFSPVSDLCSSTSRIASDLLQRIGLFDQIVRRLFEFLLEKSDLLVAFSQRLARREMSRARKETMLHFVQCGHVFLRVIQRVHLQLIA